MDKNLFTTGYSQFLVAYSSIIDRWLKPTKKIYWYALDIYPLHPCSNHHIGHDISIVPHFFLGETPCSLFASNKVLKTQFLLVKIQFLLVKIQFLLVKIPFVQLKIPSFGSNLHVLVTSRLVGTQLGRLRHVPITAPVGHRDAVASFDSKIASSAAKMRILARKNGDFGRTNGDFTWKNVIYHDLYPQKWWSSQQKSRISPAKLLIYLGLSKGGLPPMVQLHGFIISFPSHRPFYGPPVPATLKDQPWKGHCRELPSTTPPMPRCAPMWGQKACTTPTSQGEDPEVWRGTWGNLGKEV